MTAKRTRRIALSFLMLAMLVFLTGATVTVNGITLTVPDYPFSGPALLSCAPGDLVEASSVDLTGLPEGSDAVIDFYYTAPHSSNLVWISRLSAADLTGGVMVVPVPYPDASTWPLVDEVTGERAVVMAVFVQVTGPDSTQTKLSEKWWVRCVPEDGFEGCTPGYWRQVQHYDAWAATGLAPDDSYNTTFGVTAGFSPDSLGYAVQLEGGGEFALARHAAAAILNAFNPDVHYPLTPEQIIAGVRAAYASGEFEDFKDILDENNNLGCPLD